MSEPTETIAPGKHAYRRPRDAATLILVDHSATVPKVLVGKRHDKVVFQPGKFVFPGGRVDKSDYRIPVAAAMPPALEANLLKGRPKILPSRARALATSREAREGWLKLDVAELAEPAQAAHLAVRLWMRCAPTSPPCSAPWCRYAGVRAVPG